MRAFDKWRFRVKPQKIIFLDIDGVLNSMELFDKLEERDMEPFMGIDVDEDNLEQLRRRGHRLSCRQAGAMRGMKKGR